MCIALPKDVYRPTNLGLRLHAISMPLFSAELTYNRIEMRFTIPDDGLMSLQVKGVTPGPMISRVAFDSCRPNLLLNLTYTTY
jgi:hypothetical protein